MGAGPIIIFVVKSQHTAWSPPGLKDQHHLLVIHLYLEQLDNVLEWSTSSEPEALPTQPSGKSHNTSLLIIIISLYGYYMYMYGS